MSKRFHVGVWRPGEEPQPLAEFDLIHEAESFIDSRADFDLHGLLSGHYYIDDMALDPDWLGERIWRLQRGLTFPREAD